MAFGRQSGAHNVPSIGEARLIRKLERRIVKKGKWVPCHSLFMLRHLWFVKVQWVHVAT